MLMLFTGNNVDSRRIARAYIALAFAQDVAKGYVKERREEATLHPLDRTRYVREVVGRNLGRRFAGRRGTGGTTDYTDHVRSV